MIYLFILQTSRYIVVRRAIIDISYEKDFYTPQTSRYIVVEMGIIDNFILKLKNENWYSGWAGTVGRHDGPARWAGMVGQHGGLARRVGLHGTRADNLGPARLASFGSCRPGLLQY